MPILSNLSRRFHLLTTDAKPDPPRDPIDSRTHNSEADVPNEKTERKTEFVSSNGASSRVVAQGEKSASNGTIGPSTNHSNNPDVAGTGPQVSACQRKEERKAASKTTKSRSRRQEQCHGSRVSNYNIINSNGVKIGSRMSYICNVNQICTTTTPGDDHQCSKGKFREMSAEVESLTSCTSQLTLDDMFVIKAHIGHGWRDVARRLSYTEGQIEQLDENYRHRGVDEVVYQLLLDWRQANTKDAQIGHLAKVLWACREYECAERLALIHNKPT